MNLGSIHSGLSLSSIQRTQAAIGRAIKRLGGAAPNPADGLPAYLHYINADTQARGYTAAATQISEGIGLLNTAASAIQTQRDILVRIRELALESSNGSLTSDLRSQLQSELTGLVSEIRHITGSTTFNGSNLLDGSFGTRTIQAGANAGDQIAIGLPSLRIEDLFQKSGGTGSFNSRTTISTQSGPNRVALTDITGDGILDLVQQSANGAVEIRLGAGNGVYGPARTISMGQDLSDLKVLDINGDGRADIISLDTSPVAGTPSVSIAYGNGDGTFRTATTLQTGALPGSIEFADLNQDGIKDLVVGNESLNEVSVYLQSSTGSFTKAATVYSGYGPVVKLGDLNGDGIADLVTANESDATVSIHLGNGDGTFRARTTVVAGSTPVSLALTDFNRDGKLDLVTADLGDGTLSIRLGTGTGSFGSRTTIAVGSDPKQIQTADLNGDGVADLVLSGGTDANTLVFLGKGDGTFAAATTLTSGTNSSGLAIGDYNGDGISDLLVEGEGESALSIFTGNKVTRTAVSDLSVATQSSAQNLISLVDSALQRLDQASGNVSALYDRLDISRSFALLLVSDYEDVKQNWNQPDIAMETAELVRLQILAQAQVAVFAQANIDAQLVLKLLPQD